MVASVLWDGMYTHNHPSHTHRQAHTHRPPQELQKSCTTEIPMKSGGTSVHLTFCQAHFWIQHVYMWHFLPFYPHCLPHRGSISPSYFSQITGVIAEKRFVPVPFLHGRGKRARRTAKAAFAPCCLSCSASAKIVSMRVQCTCASIYVTWRGQKACYNTDLSWDPHHLGLLLLQMQNQGGKLFASMELNVEKDRQLRSLKKSKLFVSHCKVGIGIQTYTAVMHTHIQRASFSFLSSFFLKKKRSRTMSLS